MRRNHVFGGIAAVALLLGAATPVLAADKVVVAVVESLSDAPFWLAMDNGYFAEAGIDAQFERIPSLAGQVAPLSAGQIDVGSGAIAAAVYNAVGRGIPLKIVADKGRNAPGYGYNAIMVRKDLYDNGTIKSLKDMKGQTIATIGVGSSDTSILNEAMRSVGLTFDDIKVSQLALPNHIIAMENKGINMTLTPDPFATRMVEKGVAVKLATVDQFYPDAQQTVLMYSAKFIKERPEVAQRFMNAYVRGIRAYVSGLKDGRVAGKNADQVLASLIKNGREKDADLLRKMVPVTMDPSGHVNVASVKKDFAFLKEKGFITAQDVSVDELLDDSFVTAAEKTLGPYKP